MAELPMVESPNFIPETLPTATSDLVWLPPEEVPAMIFVDNRCKRSPEAGVLFTSDNFPGHHNKYTDCNYIMKATPGKRVQLIFFIFDVSIPI